MIGRYLVINIETSNVVGDYSEYAFLDAGFVCLYTTQSVVHRPKTMTNISPQMQIIQDIVHLYDPRIASITKAKETLIEHAKHICGLNILAKYPAHKQFNIINMLGYDEAAKKAMVAFMMDCREECNKEIIRIERMNDHDKLIKYIPTKPKA